MADQADEQDRMLPIANVGRLMKQILPPSAKISKDAKQTMQECSTEFISFVTSEACYKCRKENRKTINGDDICWALSALGFDSYAEVMLRYLYRYREKANNQSPSSCCAHHFSILEDKNSNIIGDKSDHHLYTKTTTTAQPQPAIGEEKIGEEISAGTASLTPNLMEFKIIEMVGEDHQHNQKSLVKSS